ncbi:MAG: HSP20 family small heat-shock protein [Myxococcota bacterium]|nr:HSP20 family small heat-shock protein [Myxococcota bacterium]
MTNMIVRKGSGELSRHPTAGDPYHWMRWDPFRQMSSFATNEEQPAHFTPDFEIKETKEGFVFRADVPGIKERNIEITMTGNRLTISGKREAEKDETSDIFFAREVSYGSFTRAFTLPDGTDGNNHIRAELAHGVLTLFLPKRPEQQPRRIEVLSTEKPKP